MENFQLSLFVKIIGISSASGLIYLDNKLYLISDSSTFLYEYLISDAKLNAIALVENPEENKAKKDKPDFEAITLKGNKLYIFGSGSTQKRNKLVVYNLENNEVKRKDLSDLYKTIQEKINLSDDELNIEGVLLLKDNILFFQRGNGNSGKNGIVCTNKNPDEIKFIPFDLPQIKNVSTTFTDAVLVEETIYFLATAEDTSSTYHDGEIMGSIIGSIDLKTMKLLNWVQITDNQKFEGLTLYNKTKDQIEFLLCEDNDTKELVSPIYLLKLTI